VLKGLSEEVIIEYLGVVMGFMGSGSGLEKGMGAPRDVVSRLQTLRAKVQGGGG